MTVAVSEASLLSSVCRESFWDFVLSFWECIPSEAERPFVANWHIEYICTLLQEMAERVFKNEPKTYDLVVNQPPATSKSSVISVLFPAWVWTRMPGAGFLFATHTESLARSLSQKSKDVIKSDKYQGCFPEVQIRTDIDSATHYANTRGGQRFTCTVAGQSPMGRHSHFQIVDDPLDPKKALSEVELKVAEHFMTEVLPSRKVDLQVSAMILVMQRLSVEDPTGTLLENNKNTPEKIFHVRLPALLDHDPEKLETTNPPELSSRYKNNLLDPKRLPREVLQEQHRALRDYAFAGQYLQSPYAKSGALFQEEYFNQRVRAAPFNSKRIRYWDRAASEASGARTAGVLLARDQEGTFYVEHVVCGQWEPFKRNEKMVATAKRDRAKYGPSHEPLIVIEGERGSTGKEAWRAIARRLAGFRVRQDFPSGDKVTRAEPWSDQLAAGTVKVVEDGSWDINAYIQEHVSFPMSKFKDQVDASSGGCNMLCGARVPGSLYTKSFSTDPRKKPILSLLVCKESDLSDLVVEGPSLLVRFSDPPAQLEELPHHNLVKCLGHTTLYFTALDPADFQSCWELEVPIYGRKPEELVMNHSQGKKLWAFLLKHRDPPATTYVFQDYGDGRALSVAYAVADTLRIPRDQGVQVVGEDDNRKLPKEAPLGHVHAMVRLCRGMVI